MYKKLVYESLNKVISFERRGTPLSNLGIGQKPKIIKWLDDMFEKKSWGGSDIRSYIINDDLTINVKGEIDFGNIKMWEFPEYIQFNKIYGSFDCRGCDLFSLKGCPKIITGDFYCHYNNLTSLEECPSFVGGNFVCINNKIKFSVEDVRKLCNVKGIVHV